MAFRFLQSAWALNELGWVRILIDTADPRAITDPYSFAMLLGLIAGPLTTVATLYARRRLLCVLIGAAVGLVGVGVVTGISYIAARSYDSPFPGIVIWGLCGAGRGGIATGLEMILSSGRTAYRLP